jgi:16S rRNA (guanine527-N7)-methyltransferase
MMNKQLEEFLSKSIAENSYNVSFATQQQLILYLDLLQRWNQVFNLTAIRDAYDMVTLHILDSLSISPYLHGTQIIDVGTGAGLPGIPLALTHPGKDFVLLDSNNKKTRFLTQAKMELGIQNIEVVQARCEEYPTTDSQKTGYDCIVSRAFSSIAVMLTSTQHLLAKNGLFVAMKGIYPEQEIRDIPEGFTVTDVHKLEIKGLAAERHVVCIQRK